MKNDRKAGRPRCDELEGQIQKYKYMQIHLYEGAVTTKCINLWHELQTRAHMSRCMCVQED